MTPPPYPAILTALAAKGHIVFEAGLLNLNIVGVRSRARQANAFDDELHVVYKETPTVWVDAVWPITTDPGLTWLNHPGRSSGCAILLPGQYRSSHTIGMHRGRYAALVQQKPMRIVRDSNQDAILDLDVQIAMGKTSEGLFGINIHAADNNPFDTVDATRMQIGPWSAGCQVFQKSEDYRAFWGLIVRASRVWGKTFSYTLIDAP